MALTALSIKRGLPPGFHYDSAAKGLYLQVTERGSASWIYRFRFRGKLRSMGLGSLELVGLANARDLAHEARRLARSGVDPIEARNAARGRVALAVSKVLTFDQAADQYIESHRQGWKNAKHAEQWANTLQTYASPVIGALCVADVDLGHVLAILEPIWATKTETASRVRGRIESVLDWATVRQYRTGENPARWKGHLDKILPQRSKVARVQHHRAIPYAELPGFMADLRTRDGTAARALEFLILTGTRSGEARGATWAEIDIEAGVWTIPADRMKAGREHRVPLSGRALAIIRECDAQRLNGYVFPAPTHEPKQLSENAFAALMKRMDRSDGTAHGFRSSLRDWCAEQTAYPHEVCEQALAHTITNAVERAYRRGDLFEKRRQLMAAWGDFCTSPQSAADVVPIRAKA